MLEMHKHTHRDVLRSTERHRVKSFKLNPAQELLRFCSDLVMTSVLRSNQTDKDVSRTIWKDRPLN